MKLHPGLIVRVNKEIVASVSSEHLNIISVRLHGDVLSSEAATLDVSGGYYGEPEATRHLLWVFDHEISEQDEIEIQFQEIATNSHDGKTIDEIHPEPSVPANGEPEDIVELAKYLQGQSRVRDGFDLYVGVGDAESQVFKIREPEYSFFVSVMWLWKSTDSARFSVSSTTIQSIAEKKSGADYLRGRLSHGQSIHVRVGSLPAKA